MKKLTFLRSEKIRYKNELVRCGEIPENDRKLIRMLKTKNLPESYFLITAAANPAEYLDLWSGSELKKDHVLRHLPYIIGFAEDEDHATKWVIELVEAAIADRDADTDPAFSLNAAIRKKLNALREEEYRQKTKRETHMES